MKKNTTYIFILFFTLFVCNCGNRPHPTIPNAKVDFYIYPNDLTYLDLNYSGGFVYLTGGVEGIIVYRLNEMTFLAYDRACPYDWKDNDSWISVNDDGLTLSCSKCRAIFNILDGSLISGPATFNNPETYTLKYYKTYFDGARLRVYN